MTDRSRAPQQDGRAIGSLRLRARRAFEIALRPLRAHGAWVWYAAGAIACTKYLNDRAQLIPKWGEWYMASEGHPYVLLQVRAFLAGKLAIVPHPTGAGHDYVWGRDGMHNTWGLGVPILATPLHVLGRLFGAPGFPDGVRFLIFYAITALLLARALHKAAPPGQPSALGASVASAGFVMVFPNFVGLVTARFLVYDQTVATGALWSVSLLAGTLALVHRCTPWRLVAVCAAAGFSTMIRPPLGVYGATTVAVAMVLAWRSKQQPAALVGGGVAYAMVTALYLAGNALRFGSPRNAGYGNTLSGAFVNRMVRWGLPFAHVPLRVAAREMFATLFFLEPVPRQIMMGTPPESVRPYAEGERWREYYSPAFDRLVLCAWVAACVLVAFRILRRRLRPRGGDWHNEVATVVGVWALAPSFVLFVFYARIGNMVTRYLTDMYPAFAAACLCVGIAVVDFVRERAPSMTGSVQLAIAGLAALYIGDGHGWAEHLSSPVDRKGVLAQIASIDAHATDVVKAPDHFQCNEPRGRPPVHSHLEDWGPDCSFRSGMVFAMARDRCVSFTFRPGAGAWSAADDQALAGFRANADFDPLVRCGAPSMQGEERRLTMCEPSPPPFLLDGMRLYAVASLDEKLQPLDRLKLMRIEATPSCR